MPAKRSAGIVVHRRTTSGGIEILLVHPGGPFWAKKHQHAWSVPKGEIEDHEEPLEAAIREFTEELGMPVPPGELVELGLINKPGTKKVVAWAVEGDLDVEGIVSNSFEMEWPPRSGRMQSFPEIDRAAWVLLDDAAEHLHKGQGPLVDLLRAKHGGLD